MDLHKAWKALQQEKFSQPNFNKDMILQAIQQESGSTMSQLKKHLFGKLIWIALFTSCTIVGMLLGMNRPELLLILSVLLLYFGTGLISTALHYKRLPENLDFAQQPLVIMKKHFRIIKSVIRGETISSLFFYPIAAIAGFCIAEHFNGVPLQEVFQDPKSLKIMLVAILVLTPLAHYGAKNANHKAFGKLMNQLQENIRRMEELA